jgi:uncharacterized membrane protein
MSNPPANQNLLIFILRNFWRLIFGLAGLAFGLSWAIFGISKTVVILLIGLLGFYFGKWIDDGRPDGGIFRLLRRYLD